jgi:hypothetical protein
MELGARLLIDMLVRVVTMHWTGLCELLFYEILPTYHNNFNLRLLLIALTDS